MSRDSYLDMLANMSRYDLELTFWDIYKQAFGTRPRHIDVAAMDTVGLIDAIMVAYDAL